MARLHENSQKSIDNKNKCLYNEHMFVKEKKLSLQEKLEILADAAKYDVACTSSGVDRKGKKGFLGNAKACGICHSFAADGRCVSLLKILMTNHCAYDCKYCVNRVSNDVPRATFSPEEICQLVVEFYKRNYIEGLFLSSGVERNPAYTMEKMCETLLLLRNKYHFNGYIHVKSIPGAPDELLATAGYLADRISINLELPTAESLKKLAPNKSFQTIMEPMGMVRDTIAVHRLAIGKNAKMERSTGNQYLRDSIFKQGQNAIRDNASGKQIAMADMQMSDDKKRRCLPAAIGEGKLTRPFAPAGQSTQMIIGATDETDFHLLQTTQELYQRYDLKRVFYSAYVPINEDSALPKLGTRPPLLREHRLYQADWLLRFYGFHAKELLSEDRPNFNEQIDPKCEWALRHLEDFPVELETAPYDKILRVPGIGPKSAGRIVKARRYGHLSFEYLKKMGVVLKRAHYFVTCGGKMMYKIPLEEEYITNQLIAANGKENWQVAHQGNTRQMSLFSDFHLHS